MYMYVSNVSFLEVTCLHRILCTCLFPEYRLKDIKIQYKSVMENVKIKIELQNLFKKCYYSVKINRLHVECIIMILQKKYIFWIYFRKIVPNYCLRHLILGYNNHYK